MHGIAKMLSAYQEGGKKNEEVCPSKHSFNWLSGKWDQRKEKDGIGYQIAKVSSRVVVVFHCKLT